MHAGAPQTTIFALATATGRAGVAVVRVSGPESWKSLQRLAARTGFVPRVAQLHVLRDPVSHETLDHALVLPFLGPASYTGEDVVEYHIHGGRAVIESLLGALSREQGHRLAEPGEFTRRAFESGKMDLTEAEAVADLIEAQTSAQKIQALSQLGGALSNLYQGWAGNLTRLLAHVEADIEFPDEALPEGIAPEVLTQIKDLYCAIQGHCHDNRRGERLREGLQIAVIGAPNAGKSSLVNALAQRDVAIVSDVAGTTRDVIEAHLDIGGYPVIVSDTAGLRPEQVTAQGDGIEREGIRRAYLRAQDADVTVLVFDGTDPLGPDPYTLALIDDRSLLVTNKMEDASAKNRVTGAIALSVHTEEGLQTFLEALKSRLDQMMVSRETPSLTRKRHRTALEEVLHALERALAGVLPELLAEDLRLALRSLGRITGRVDVEEVLDVIFKDFCIGK